MENLTSITSLPRHWSWEIFDSAVTLCLSAERFSDAILLAAKGGPELLKKTQAAYFERRTISLPYLRLFQSIVGNDLANIVQNADLKEWQVIFVILCTYASSDEFATLVEQLGLRLEFQGNLVKTSGVDDAESKAKVFEEACHTVLSRCRQARESRQYLGGGNGGRRGSRGCRRGKRLSIHSSC
jgi:hypothetical protein